MICEKEGIIHEVTHLILKYLSLGSKLINIYHNSPIFFFTKFTDTYVFGHLNLGHFCSPNLNLLFLVFHLKKCFFSSSIYIKKINIPATLKSILWREDNFFNINLGLKIN